MKIQIPDMLIKLREQLHEETEPRFWERWAYGFWARTLRRPWMYRMGTWMTARTIGRWKRKSGWLSRLPGKLNGWTQRRDFPAPAPQRFRDWWKTEGRKEK